VDVPCRRALEPDGRTMTNRGPGIAQALVVVGLLVLWGAPLGAQEQTIREEGDLVTIRLANADFRSMLQAFGRYLDKPVLTGTLGEVRIEFFETPVPVARSQVPDLIRGLAQANGLFFREDSTFFRVGTEEVVDAGVDDSATTGAADSVPVVLGLFTIRLKHARAADVAATLNQLYGSGGAFSGRRGLSSGTLSDALRPSVPAGAAVEQEAPAETGASLRGTVTIVPDELTNTLLIRSTQEDFDVLTQGVDVLDVRPLQVLIEVIAVEARKDRQFALGFDVEVPEQDFGDGKVSGSFLGAGLGDLAVRVMGLGKEQVNARLTAARTRGDVEIVSRPVLLASNNTEARLLVGTQQPFVQVSRSLPTDTPQRDQVVQYRDVGTKLTVLPTINQDGYVSLLIQQELSQATGETQFSAPVISTRETVTQVLVGDGQTIVIGGLRDRVQDETRTGIPLLSDIPLIGGLFGGTRKRTTETELYLFITPTIIDDDVSARKATDVRLNFLPEGIIDIQMDSVYPLVPRPGAPKVKR
jgi:type II secretory pathway component GspD/PulD (secretin)